jgi:nucleotide-binding universal stress UspA family protein
MLLLHLVVPLYLYAPTADPFGAVLPGPHAEQEWDEAARRGARAHVDALAEQVVRLGVEAEGCALSGPVAETIVGAAEHARADVIVMSTHARTGPARAFYGSIAAAVVRGSGRPVLLVRRDASTWAPGGDRARGRRLAPASGG